MGQLIIIIHVLAAVSIVSLVLLQQGKGSDVGAAFGSGSSNTMFGSQGSMPFFMKLTVFCAVIFFVTSLSLARIAHEQVAGTGRAAPLPTPTAPTSPDQTSSLPMTNSLPVQKITSAAGADPSSSSSTAKSASPSGEKSSQQGVSKSK